MNLIIVAFAAFCGGVLAAFLGFLDSKEAWDSRKFGKSVGMALLSALGFAVAYAFTDGVTVKDCFLAFLSGAGVDVLSNRALGASSSIPPTSPPPAPSGTPKV